VPAAIVGLSVAWLGLMGLLSRILWRWPGLVSNSRVALLFKGMVIAGGIVMLIISVLFAVLAMLVGLLFLPDPSAGQFRD